MKQISLLLVLLILFTGCTGKSSHCGDGICDQFEREQGVCPEDCAPLVSEQDTSTEGILYIGMMIHLEGWDTEIENRNQFIRHAQAAREMAALFEAHGACATFEARPEFVRACQIWDDNVLAELYERGHGIGVHADMGGSVEKEGLTQELFSTRIASLKEEMESVTGLEIIHVSGICSTLDWISAAADAGYTCVSGCVGYCAMSLPPHKRPQAYTSCKNPAQCHGVIPLAFEERLHPWRTSTARNWLQADPEGNIVILPANGGLYHLEEEYGTSTSYVRSDTFSREDIIVYRDLLEEALQYTEKDTVNIFYVAVSIGNPHIDESLFHEWFEIIQPYLDSGHVQWKTLPDMYRQFIARESEIS
jgi:hypothetical protein